MKVTKAQLRVRMVLERIGDEVATDPDAAERWSEMFQEFLSEAASNDAFGTEGQCDPRGDFRNGEWSMVRVEGIDK